MTAEEFLAYNIKKSKEYPLLVKRGFASKKEINSNYIEYDIVLSETGSHTFVGYYDINNISNDGMLFFLRVSKNASPSINYASINIYDINNQKIDTVVKTRAWNWQQGCRASWLDNDHIAYNDCENKYVCKKVNVKTKKTSLFCNEPLYDYSLKSGYGASVNFGRLQALRPGYGYSINSYKLIETAPKDDGLFLVNLSTKENRLVCSLHSLKKQVSNACDEDDYHYINHIKFSPNGTKIMFFHLWTKDSLGMWKMRMMIYDLLTSELYPLEDKEIVSHYTWINDDEIMATCVLNNQSCYYVYNVKDKNKKLINDKELTNDGHPSFFNDSNYFISDTYPLDNSMQHLFVFDRKNSNKLELLNIFSDPRLFIEKRCDLHPRLDEDHNIINIDSTFSDRLRKVVILKYKKDIIYDK